MWFIFIVAGVIGAILAIIVGYLVMALGWIFQRKSPEEVGGIRERQERLARRRDGEDGAARETEGAPLVVHASHPAGDQPRTTVFRPSTHQPRDTK